MAMNVVKPVHLISAGDMSADIISPAFECLNQDNIGIQLHWTGTPTGTFSFQVSNNHLQDIEGNIIVAGNWVELPVTPAIIAVGAGDDAYVDLNQVGARYCRVVYTATGGAGSLDAFVSAKGI